MTLGILKLAAVLESAGHVVNVLDLSGIGNYEEVVGFYAKSSVAGVFGITATTPQLPAAVKIAKVIRSLSPESRIILGGPHVTLVNAAYKRERLAGECGRAVMAMCEIEEIFDVLVAGDGEAAIFEALKKDTPKLIDADIANSWLFLTDERLTQTPFPARHLVDVDSYHYTIDGVRALSLIAQLGCPFSCGFCGGRQSPTFRRIRTRTSENIIEEMVHIHLAYGIRGFMMYDDELNVNKQMISLMHSIARAQEDLKSVWRLRGFIKSQLFDDLQAAAMYAAGFRWILVGFESGSPRILDNIQKKATVEDNTRCMEIARRHGLKVKALMSVGHPGESSQTIKESREWLLDVKPDDFDVSIITAYPGTPYYDLAKPEGNENVWVYTQEKTGDRLYEVSIRHTVTADYYKGDPNGGYKSYVFTDHLSAQELVEARNGIEREVRHKLDIPFNATASKQFEHSMGMSGALPPSVLRSSKH